MIHVFVFLYNFLNKTSGQNYNKKSTVSSILIRKEYLFKNMLKVRQIKVPMLGCVTLLWSLSLCTGFQHLHQSIFFLPSRSSGHVGERDHHCLCINGLLGIFLRTQGAQIAEAIKNLRSNVYS